MADVQAAAIGAGQVQGTASAGAQVSNQGAAGGSIAMAQPMIQSSPQMMQQSPMNAQMQMMPANNQIAGDTVSRAEFEALQSKYNQLQNNYMTLQARPQIAQKSGNSSVSNATIKFNNEFDKLGNEKDGFNEEALKTHALGVKEFIGTPLNRTFQDELQTDYDLNQIEIERKYRMMECLKKDPDMEKYLDPVEQKRAKEYFNISDPDKQRENVRNYFSVYEHFQLAKQAALEEASRKAAAETAINNYGYTSGAEITNPTMKSVLNRAKDLRTYVNKPENNAK